MKKIKSNIKWQKKYPDKVREIQKRYYQKNKEKIIERTRLYHQKNKNKYKKYDHKRYLENRDEILLKKKFLYQQQKKENSIQKLKDPILLLKQIGYYNENMEEDKNVQN